MSGGMRMGVEVGLELEIGLRGVLVGFWGWDDILHDTPCDTIHFRCQALQYI